MGAPHGTFLYSHHYGALYSRVYIRVYSGVYMALYIRMRMHMSNLQCALSVYTDIHHM